MTNLSSYRYSGLVHKKTLGVVPAADKKGFTVVLKKAKYQVSSATFPSKKQKLTGLCFPEPPSQEHRSCNDEGWPKEVTEEVEESCPWQQVPL